LPFSILFSDVPAVTPDGKWVLYPGRDSSGKPGLFRIPSTGDQPERLGDLPNRLAEELHQIRPSPDGRKILVTRNLYSSRELWLLENFVPSAK
jgi:hypothetical protein